MKRTLVAPDLSRFPEEFHPLLRAGRVYDSSCSPEARVWLLEGEGGCFLKCAPKGTLKTEGEMTSYFFRKGLGAEVLAYRSGEKDWLLTRRVAGEDCTHADYLAEPVRLCDLLAERLRMLHETDFDACPVPDRMAGYLATVEENYRKGQYDLSLFSQPFSFASPKEAYALVAREGKCLKSDTLLHGDYCLPNIMLDRWRFSGFIDLGNGGVGDRHVDLFWGAWTLNFNLKTDRYRNRFFDVYGRDRVEPDLLRVVGAAEVFG